MMALSVERRVTSTGQIKIDCSGIIEAQNVHRFRSALHAIMVGPADVVTVDLRRVHRIDAAGVAALASAARTFRCGGAIVRLIEPERPSARRFLDFSGLVPLLAA